MKSLTRGNFKASMDSVRGAKMRNFWTMFGIIVGVASVISVVSIGEGIKAQISQQIHHYGANVITIRPAELHSSNSASNNVSLLSDLTISSTLNMQDAVTVSHTKGVVASTPLSIVSGQIKGDSGVYNGGFVIGTSSDLPSLLNQSLAYGSFFDDGASDVAVIGQDVALSLFDEDVPLGRGFDFHGHRLVVVGIFNEFNSPPLSQQADFNKAVFIPKDLAQQLTNNTAPIYEILAKAGSAKQTPQVVGAVRQALNHAHGGQSNLSVLAGSQNLAPSNDILQLLTKMIAGVAAISLVVGGIGIMDVMLVSVAERTHEIGIRKAVGATNRQILGQFIIESGVLSLVGGLIGVVVAFLIDVALRVATDLQPLITWQVVVLAAGVSLLIGVLFGSIPALQAAKKHPIDALRAN